MAFLRKKTLYCISNDDMDEEFRLAFSVTCIVTASLSSYGALVQLKSWYRQLKDYQSRRLPSSNPPVVFSLALADLFACIGVIAMAGLFLWMEPPNRDSIKNVDIPAKAWYWKIGVPTEAFTMFSYVASYFWTLAYSIDICLQVYGKDKCINMWTYSVICWLSPLWLVIWGEYGFLENTINPRYCSYGEKGLLHYMVCFGPLLIVTVLLPIVYFIAFRKIQRNIRGAFATYTNAERQILTAVKWKFSFIILVFMFCWLLNVGDGIHDGFNTENDDFGVHKNLWIVEAVVNPLQGFFNCIVYGHGREMLCCYRQNHVEESQCLPWNANTRTSDTSESFLVNSQDILEYSKSACVRPLLGGEQRRSYGYMGNASPMANIDFVPKLLGEPRRT
ncbi:uncharacterized protein LOC5520373 isoform X1 [Nematostella vectensis]|uniref:uncharacterized protein LOC5520373 isoform X1 n=1 Tax=Nematostella vectensis TaxID=45351 RepID=UPI0013901BF8|nr:uncharacterized protein LOC5520373 isoform X1 [Nematostella vectensis]